ncbi:hypothetical protein Tco_1351775 [Tanacetum coccineum]
MVSQKLTCKIYKPGYIVALYLFYHERKPDMVTCPLTLELKRSSELDLNGHALPDGDDDRVVVEPLENLGADKDNSKDHYFYTLHDPLTKYQCQIPKEATNEEPISIPFCDPPQSGKDRLQLIELMNLCTKLQKQVHDLEEAKSAQAKEIASLKKRVKQLEKRKKLRTLGLKRLRKVGLASRVESSNDNSLGAQEDDPKREENSDLDADLKKTEVAEKRRWLKEVSVVDTVTVDGKLVTTTSTTTIIDELTLAQTLIEIKAAKPKAKKKKVAQEEASRAAIIKELDSIQAMIKADEQLDARLQAEEQEQFFIEEKSRMLVEMIVERKKFFAAQRAA